MTETTEECDEIYENHHAAAIVDQYEDDTVYTRQGTLTQILPTRITSGRCQHIHGVATNLHQCDAEFPEWKFNEDELLTEWEFYR